MGRGRSATTPAWMTNEMTSHKMTSHEMTNSDPFRTNPTEHIMKHMNDNSAEERDKRKPRSGGNNRTETYDSNNNTNSRRSADRKRHR